MLQRVLARGGAFASPFWKTSQIDVPDVDPSKLSAPGIPAAPTNMPSVPISGPQDLTPMKPSSPSVPALGGLGLFPGAAPTPMDWLQMAQYKAPTTPAAPAPVAPAAAPTAPAASVPLPMARPAGAPAPQEDTGFFMRNALMQQDPNGGGFIDPIGASSVKGPDLIAKMMAYLHQKV